MDHAVLDVSGRHRRLPDWSHPTLVATAYLVLAFVVSFVTGTVRLDIAVVVIAIALWPANPSAIAGAVLGTVAGNLANSGSTALLVSALGTAVLAAPAFRRSAHPDTLPSRLGLRLGYLSAVALVAGTFEHRLLVDRNRWAEHTLHAAIGIFVGAVVISFMRRRRIYGPVLGTASMLTATAASVLFTIAFWDQRDESLLRLTNETVSVGLLQGITDDLNVVNTKATSATDLTADGFAQSLQVTVLGNDSVRGVQLVEFDATGAPQVTAVLSEFGTDFDDVLAAWVVQQDPAVLQSSVAFGVSEYLDLLDLPTLDGGSEPNLVYVVPLFPDASNQPRVMVFTLGLPPLLEGAITPTIAAQGNASVDLFRDVAPGATPLWSNNGGTYVIGDDGLIDQSAVLDVTAVTIGTSEFVLTARPGVDFGTPTRFRRLILGLEGVGGLLLVALLLIGADQGAQRERERRRREALLAAALQGSPGWTAVIDTNDRVVMANNNEHGVPAGALVTESMVCTSDDTARTAVLAMLDRARAGEDATYTHHWSAPDDATNSMRIFQIDVRPLPDPRLVYLQCVDVTEQRDRAMRTAQSERMEAIGVLAGSLAHDFNNLLFITLGYLQMLERQPIVANDAQASTFVSRAVEAVERGATVAKSLLSFARSQPLEATAINMHTFLADLRPLVDQAIHGAHDLHVDVEGEGLDVVVDPGRLSSGLLNIIFNARDAMDAKGSITIRVRRGEATASDGAAREMISIAVTDTGKGMSAEVAARAFEPFFTTKQVGSGTGLGLATVYSFAQQSGGWATIDSTEGAGTTITIFLPPAFSEALHEPAADTATEWAVRRVLVIDDEPALADLVAAWIGDLGLSTRTANTPEEALKVADEFKPQLVVSDANLRADMDGLDVARELVELMPSLVVIFMTGFSDRIKALQAAGVATLAKPFTRDDLVKVLSQNVGIRHDDSSKVAGQ
ncbi:MAG: ATP-binding protein [Ilumatobacteraceae bacterium]